MLDIQASHGLENLIRILVGELGSNLISVILYGSYARGEWDSESDLDLYIFARELPKDPLQRRFMLNRIQSKLGPGIQLRGATLDEAIQVFPLMLDLAQDGIPIYDPQGIASRMLKALRSKMRKQGWIRHRLGPKLHGWICLKSEPGNHLELRLDPDEIGSTS